MSIESAAANQLETNGEKPQVSQRHIEVLLLLAIFFIYAGDAPPGINEAHYMVKAKNFWQPDWCANDLFVASGKAHTAFYTLFGWPTLFFSLETTAWIGRLVGWLLIAIGLQRLTRCLISAPFACLAVATIWITAIEYGNLAGEWVIGGIEAKVPAYGFVLMAIAEMVDRRWNRVWILMGIASGLHVLSGGWSVVAAAVTWWITERKRSDAHPFFTRYLFLGGAIAMIGVVPAMWLTMGTPANESILAAKIYTYYRLSHHLVPSSFESVWYLRFAVITSAALTLAVVMRRPACPLANSTEQQKWDRVQSFSIGALGIALIGLVFGFLPMLDRDLSARLLRYYWFRLSDTAIPLWLSLLVARGLFDARLFGRNRSETRQEFRTRRLLHTICIAATVLAVGLFSFSSWQSIRIPVPPSVSNRVVQWDVDAPASRQQDVLRDWVAVCKWVRKSTDPDEVFLTPRHQQTFKWYAERAEVVNKKDVPQNDKDLIDWYRRFQDVFPKRLGTIRVTIQYASLIDYRERYGVNMIVIDRRVAGQHLPLVKLYPLDDKSNVTYAVYELPYALP